MTVLFEKYGFDGSCRRIGRSSFIRVADVKESPWITCVAGEVDNIAMYNKFLEQDIPDDVRATFTALRNASEGHLQVVPIRASRNIDKQSLIQEEAASRGSLFFVVHTNVVLSVRKKMKKHCISSGDGYAHRRTSVTFDCNYDEAALIGVRNRNGPRTPAKPWISSFFHKVS